MKTYKELSHEFINLIAFQYSPQNVDRGSQISEGRCASQVPLMKGRQRRQRGFPK